MIWLPARTPALKTISTPFYSEGDSVFRSGFKMGTVGRNVERKYAFERNARGLLGRFDDFFAGHMTLEQVRWEVGVPHDIRARAVKEGQHAVKSLEAALKDAMPKSAEKGLIVIEDTSK